MAKIFISHASADKKIANQFYQLLLDALDLQESDIFFTSRPGGPLMDGELYNMIKDQIRECTSIIFLFSKNFLKSEDCKMEYHYADGCNKSMHVFLLDGMSHNDLQRTPFYSSLCRQLNNKENLLNVLRMLKSELSLTSLDESKFEPAVIFYLRLGYSGGYYSVPGKFSDSVYTNEEADKYIGNLESNYKQFDEAKYLLGCALFDGVLVKADEDRALRLIENCAYGGYVPALLKLAYFYSIGVGIRYPQFDEAFKCLEFAERTGSFEPRVYAAKGLMYYYGVGCCRNLDTAREFFLKGKRFNDFASLKYLNFLDKNRKTTKPTFKSVEDAASDGDPEVLYKAGMLNLTGGMSFYPDLDKAYKYLSCAASKGNIKAEGILGQFSYFGWGSGERNFDEAVVHFQKAAENGDQFYQCFLGDLCKYGLLEGGWHRASDWYERAAVQGDAKSNLALAVMRGQYGYEFSYRDAFYHLLDAAYGKEGGKADRDAQCVLGDVYYFGLLGQDQNSGLANRYYETASFNGSIVAELRLHPRFWE